MKSEIRKEIEKYFALHSGNGAYSLSSLYEPYPAWVFKQGREYGVMLPYNGEDVSESFSGATMQKRLICIGGSDDINVLILACCEAELRNEFSLICEDFIAPGNDGGRRREILSNPLQWWEKWRGLLGDAASEKLVYDIIGELWAVLKLFQIGKKPYWSASKLNSRDIELFEESYEVKSTIKKGISQIHVNSQVQFDSEKLLYLVFTRLEESLTGKSIDDLLKEIYQYDPKRISEYNSYLESRGFVIGNHLRKIRYTILERRIYLVDERFPRITEEMFKDGKLPTGITHLEYNVSLDGIPYENWK